jgi:hypothetical protein
MQRCRASKQPQCIPCGRKGGEGARVMQQRGGLSSLRQAPSERRLMRSSTLSRMASWAPTARTCTREERWGGEGGQSKPDRGKDDSVLMQGRHPQRLDPLDTRGVGRARLPPWFHVRWHRNVQCNVRVSLERRALNTIPNPHHPTPQRSQMNSRADCSADF